MTKNNLNYKKIISKYIVSGIPASSIPGLMKALNRSEERFAKYMNGQTVGLVGGEALYYPWDIESFYENRPPLD